MQIILGSQSKGRRGVMEQMGYPFIVMNPNIDEKKIRSSDARELTRAIANAKADALLPHIHEPSLLITSDQVVTFRNEIREKPETPDEARAFLGSYGDEPVQTVTAVVVVNTQTGERREEIDIASVWFNPFPPDVIEEIIQQGDVFTYAGGFSISHPLMKPYISKIAGEFESIIGLPKQITQRVLKELGAF